MKLNCRLAFSAGLYLFMLSIPVFSDTHYLIVPPTAPDQPIIEARFIDRSSSYEIQIVPSNPGSPITVDSQSEAWEYLRRLITRLQSNQKIVIKVDNGRLKVYLQQTTDNPPPPQLLLTLSFSSEFMMSHSQPQILAMILEPALVEQFISALSDTLVHDVTPTNIVSPVSDEASTYYALSDTLSLMFDPSTLEDEPVISPHLIAAHLHVEDTNITSQTTEQQILSNTTESQINTHTEPMNAFTIQLDNSQSAVD